MAYDLEETDLERPIATRTFSEKIWRRKLCWIGSLAVCLGLAFTYIKYATPIYEATAQLLLQQVRSPNDTSRSVPHGVDFAATQAKVIGSPVVVKGALERVKSPHINPESVTDLLMVMESLSVEKVPQTDVVSIRFRSDDKQFAAKLVDALIAQYQSHLLRQQELLQTTEIQRADSLKLQQQLWEAQGQEKEMAQRFGTRHPELRAVQEKIAVWTKLLQERNGSQSTPDVTGDDSLEKVGGVKIAVLNGPASPEAMHEPVWPKALIIYPAGALIGLLIGFGMVAFAERVDDTLRTSRDAELRVGMRICGQIPQIPASEGHPFRTYRCVLQSPGSSVAKAFRALAREVMSYTSNSHAGLGRVIQVTSAGDGAGKTTVVSNLAATLARSGVKVVVVDGDLRRGTLHRVFDVSPAKGLTAVMVDGTDVDDLVQSTSMARVDVLTKGPAVRNPLHLLAQPEVEKVLESLRGRYDVILVDTPSLLSLSDASLLAPCADVVLLVLQAGKSSAGSVRRALDMLDSVGTKMVGTVLNRSQPMRWAPDVDDEQAVIAQEPAVAALPAASAPA